MELGWATERAAAIETWLLSAVKRSSSHQGKGETYRNIQEGKSPSSSASFVPSFMFSGSDACLLGQLRRPQ
jgi:hypothetical protein